MFVFSYDEKGFYCGKSVADKSPIEDDVFLIPAYATLIKPLDDKENFTQKFDGEKWNYVPLEDIEKELNVKEDFENLRISKIKAKAGEIIINRYSIVWQLNHPRTDETYKAEYEWIDKIREISNKAELEGTAMEDINWDLI